MVINCTIAELSIMWRQAAGRNADYGRESSEEARGHVVSYLYCPLVLFWGQQLAEWYRARAVPPAQPHHCPCELS